MHMHTSCVYTKTHMHCLVPTRNNQACKHTSICIHSVKHTSTSSHKRKHKNTCTHTHTHAHTHTCIHTRAHTCGHTYARTHPCQEPSLSKFPVYPSVHFHPSLSPGQREYPSLAVRTGTSSEAKCCCHAMSCRMVHVGFEV